MDELAARRRQRGFALVAVLWGVAILSLIAAVMLSGARTTALLDRNVWNATRAGAADDAAVNLAVLALMDDRSDRQPRVDGTAWPITFDGVKVRIRIQDEAGRINPNYVDRDVLVSLFASVGVARDDAQRLADAVIARRPPPSQTGGPTARTFRGLSDLLSVKGMTPELLARIRPAITVFGQGNGVNVNVAPRATLRALPDMTEAAIADALKQREDARAQARLLPPTSGSRPAGAGSVFTITAEARVNGARVVREAVVQFTGDDAKPYAFIAWK